MDELEEIRKKKLEELKAKQLEQLQQQTQEEEQLKQDLFPSPSRGEGQGEGVTIKTMYDLRVRFSHSREIRV